MGRVPPVGTEIRCALTASSYSRTLPRLPRGAIAQLGERYNGIVEVAGSIPAGSTTHRQCPHRLEA